MEVMETVEGRRMISIAATWAGDESPQWRKQALDLCLYEAGNKTAATLPIDPVSVPSEKWMVAYSVTSVLPPANFPHNIKNGPVGF